MGLPPAAYHQAPSRARSSVGERSLHTREVAGSKPAAPIVPMAARAGFFTPLALRARSKPAAPIVPMAAGAGFFTPLASLLVRNQPRPSSRWPPGLVSSHHSHP